MTSAAKTHVLTHYYEGGSDAYYFLPPKGFVVPYGSFEGKGKSEPPELQFLINYLEIDFDPKEGEMVEVKAWDDTVHEPTLAELTA